jgi:hypothetical protein
MWEAERLQHKIEIAFGVPKRSNITCKLSGDGDHSARMPTGSVGSERFGQLKLARFVVAALATGLVASGILLGIYFTVRNASRAREPRMAAASTQFAPSLPNLWVNALATGTGRPVYAYSVIPGGVANAQELSRASLRDPIVAAHYADFHVPSAHLIRLLQERRVYLSYRIGNRVYWTKQQVTLSGFHCLVHARRRSASPGHGWPAPIPVGPPPPAVTPEPSAMVQFLIGLAAALLVIKLRR